MIPFKLNHIAEVGKLNNIKRNVNAKMKMCSTDLIAIFLNN